MSIELSLTPEMKPKDPILKMDKSDHPEGENQEVNDDWSFTILWQLTAGMYFGCIGETSKETICLCYNSKRDSELGKANLFWPLPIWWILLTIVLYTYAIIEIVGTDTKYKILNAVSTFARIIVTIYNVLFGAKLFSNRDLATILQESENGNFQNCKEGPGPPKMSEVISNKNTKTSTMSLVSALKKIMLTTFCFNATFFMLFLAVNILVSPAQRGTAVTIGLLIGGYVETVFMVSNVMLSLIYVWILWCNYTLMASRVKYFMESREERQRKGESFSENAQQVKEMILTYLDVIEVINAKWKWFHMIRIMFGTVVVANLASKFYLSLFEIENGGEDYLYYDLIFYLVVFLFLFFTLWLTVLASGIANEFFYDYMQRLLTENEIMKDKEQDELRYFFNTILMGRSNVGYEMFFTYVSPENALTLASLALFVINYTLSVERGED